VSLVDLVDGFENPEELYRHFDEWPAPSPPIPGTTKGSRHVVMGLEPQAFFFCY
jgi:hypothetical protein